MKTPGEVAAERRRLLEEVVAEIDEEIGRILVFGTRIFSRVRFRAIVRSRLEQKGLGGETQDQIRDIINKVMVRARAAGWRIEEYPLEDGYAFFDDSA